MGRSDFGSISEEGRDRWRVRVSAGKDPLTGKRMRISRTVRGTKRDAVAELLRMQAELGRGGRGLSKLTVGAFALDVYLPRKLDEVARGEYQPTSYESVLSSVKNHVVPGIGHIRMRDLTPYAVEAWLARIDGPQARRKAFSTWRTMHRQAAAWGLADRSVADGVKAPPKVRPEIKVLDAPGLARVLGAFHGEKVEAYVLLMSGCGLRLSEAAALNWEDVDLEARTASVSKSFHVVRGKAYFGPTKTPGSKRVVALPPFVAARLSEIKGGRFAAEGDPVVPCSGKHGRVYPHYAATLYRKVWGRKVDGVEFVALKNMRHTHATILRESGADMAAIAERLGHANLATTMERYVKAHKTVDARMSEVFDSALASLFGPDAAQRTGTGPDESGRTRI